MKKFGDYHWTGKHILIVEDDESSSFLLKEILKRTGANLAFSFAGAEAVDYIRNHPEIDVVLMDLHLPGQDGIAATLEIRELRSDIVVIAQTAHIFIHDLKQAKEVGFDDYMIKPLDAGLLLSTIDHYMASPLITLPSPNTLQTI